MITAANVSLYLYLIIIIGLVISYSPRLVCWCYARKKQKRLVNDKKNKIAIIIPARNESMAVGPLFRSINEQSYDKAFFDAHVIVADENDKTLEMAKKSGVRGFVCADQTCKGDALDFCLKTLLAEDSELYDAFVIVDADCILDKDFCLELNNALSTGAEVICAKKKVKNYFFGGAKEQPLSACCNAIIWTLIDNMGNTYKSEHGYPCFTVGTGLMLSKKAVKTLGGWPYRATVTEDMELLQDIVLRGWKCTYYQHAFFYMEEATALSVTNKRRRRWMTGVVDSRRIYAEAHKGDPKRHEKSKDFFHVTCLNRVYAMMGISALYSFASFIFAAILALFGVPVWKHLLFNAIVAAGFIYLAFFVMTLVALIADWENIRIPFYKKMLVLFWHPIFYMKYIEIVFTATFTGKGRCWDVIDRVSFEEEEENDDTDKKGARS